MVNDLTLSLLFSNPAMLAIAPRLRSFGWRLRASPPSALREFDNSTMYVSVQGWLKECTSLGFLVLDSDIETEGVREVDLERVVKCLGEGRERTVRRRLKEARKEAKLARQDPATYQALLGGPTGGVKRKLVEADGRLRDDTAKRQRAVYDAMDMDAVNGLRHQPLTKDRLDLRNHKHASQHDQHHPIALTASRAASSNLSLMLCGPIQGWILSPAAEMWAAENMDDLRTWMSETKSALRMVKTASDDDELSPRGRSQAQKADYTDSAKADEVTAVSEHMANGPPDRITVPTTSMLSPISVLSSSYSPVIQMSGVGGGNSYFAHHPNHTIHQEMQGMQPYIYHISNAPYQPQFSGIVPSYAQPTSRDGPAPTLSSMVYPIRPPVRSHSRSFSPLSDAERRKAALNDRPPVFLDGIVREFTGIKELFIDRPIRAPYGSEEETLMLLVCFPHGNTL
ncbi:hypothetical protein QFC22_003163 [Naganishia vaughanmartiniae]|uniref:Uncharacterized protein n=1 Tax=Naganishia vaughanmartiniae TaxID=1424756 RepID=A0ACC2X897_9TREE|nr:hypothetical protein QFC22_003163 [Naganishia vaughanmartiniae]